MLDEKALILVPVGQFPGREHMPTRGFAVYDDRQRNTDMLAVHGGDVPVIGIHHVTVKILVHVERLGSLCGSGGLQQKKERYEERQHHTSTHTFTRLSFTSTNPSRI